MTDWQKKNRAKLLEILERKGLTNIKKHDKLTAKQKQKLRRKKRDT